MLDLQTAYRGHLKLKAFREHLQTDDHSRLEGHDYHDITTTVISWDNLDAERSF
jgi:hypothetical protein